MVGSYNSRLAAAVPDASYDGKYYPRYPYGNKPYSFAANAGAVASAAPALQANPNVQLLAYLNSLSASSPTRILSGQHTDYFTGASATPWDNFTSGTTAGSANVAGYYPAMIGLAVQGPYNNGNPTQQSIGGAAGIVALANGVIATGGIPLITSWMGNPASNNFGAAANSGDLTACFSASNGILVNGSTIQNNYLANLATIAALLNQINGAYIYRPFTEVNGNWNWYGYGGYTNGPTAAQFQALWTLTRNYLIGLGVNCLWDYNVNTNTGAAGTYTAGFVAGQTDVVSIDSFSDTPGTLAQTGSCYSSLVATGCPIIFSLLGSGSYSAASTTSYDTILGDIKTNCPAVVGVCVWCQGWSLAANPGAAAFMTDTVIVDRESAAPPLTPSASGTTITAPGAQIVDASLNVWTLVAVSGEGYEVYISVNGATPVAAGVSFNVITLLYYQSTIYQENSSGQWFAWIGTTWNGPTTDPHLPGASPNGTTLSSETGSIVDASANVWTLGAGVGGGNYSVYENGATVGISYNVILLLWYNGDIYQENASNQWFEWSGTAWTAVSGDPRALMALWPDPLPDGIVGQPYSYTLTAANGVTPYTFSIASGSLPPGLTLNASTGVISGTPTVTASMQAVSFTVTDSS